MIPSTPSSEVLQFLRPLTPPPMHQKEDVSMNHDGWHYVSKEMKRSRRYWWRHTKVSTWERECCARALNAPAQKSNLLGANSIVDIEAEPKVIIEAR
jgi:hypothetical protein